MEVEIKKNRLGRFDRSDSLAGQIEGFRLEFPAWLSFHPDQSQRRFLTLAEMKHGGEVKFVGRRVNPARVGSRYIRFVVKETKKRTKKLHSRGGQSLIKYSVDSRVFFASPKRREF